MPVLESKEPVGVLEVGGAGNDRMTLIDQVGKRLGEHPQSW